jgi:hypothetical protein
VSNTDDGSAWAGPATPKHFISASCGMQKCGACGWPATHKLEETIFHDDPLPARHPLTSYVCCAHFRLIVGGTCE